MKSHHGAGMASAALAIYFLGGIGTFAGLFFIVFMGDKGIGSWGKGSSMGYLLFCVGLCCSIAGVMLMRLIRNRADR